MLSWRPRGEEVQDRKAIRNFRCHRGIQLLYLLLWNKGTWVIYYELFRQRMLIFRSVVVKRSKCWDSISEWPHVLLLHEYILSPLNSIWCHQDMTEHRIYQPQHHWHLRPKSSLWWRDVLFTVSQEPQCFPFGYPACTHRPKEIYATLSFNCGRLREAYQHPWLSLPDASPTALSLRCDNQQLLQATSNVPWVVKLSQLRAIALDQ